MENLHLIFLAKVEHDHDHNAKWARDYGEIIDKKILNITRHSFICTNNNCIDI